MEHRAFQPTWANVRLFGSVSAPLPAAILHKGAEVSRQCTGTQVSQPDIGCMAPTADAGSL